MKKQSGFTLIELLLVLAIIGIIAAIAIPALLGQREKAKAKATQSMVANIAGELARVNDDLRQTGTTPTAAAVVTAVLKLSNYNFPAAKNPYGGSTAPYTAAAAGTTLGLVYLTANSTYSDPATSKTYPAVVVTATYKDGTTTPKVTKVVALD
ncbi:MAG: prepilin-type N-terminal cleavage/methylation domain-containing protein [Acidobacteria bacterium]|nr:prepilin-type N-terminal cleavage/methylation domain-containing protein [Acidobacteriota bacterium]MBI1855589.1 prepilin-type N-terminal cleavage/methylation domain-containing protein [Chloroflexota bacterium]MBI3488422.1 prepilin-type N-terminal cleavage/methylation domain-containing protein [Acidobacteriota bacterium]